MSRPRAHVRKFLKDRVEQGAGLVGKRGWFTTREIYDAILPELKPDTKMDQISDTLCILRGRGEIETVKGAAGNSYYGYHRFVKDPDVLYHTGHVGMVPRHRDPAHQRELYRLRELAKGRVVGVDRKPKPKPKKAPANTPRAPVRTKLGYAVSDIQPAPPKPVFETYEEFVARGGKAEVLPGVNIQPRYVRCALNCKEK